MIYSFVFTGYREYINSCADIQKILQENLQDNDENFFIAINEAVCNAAKYSIAGIENAMIEIELRIESYEVQAKIKSDSARFDAELYRQKLQTYTKNQKIKEKDWQDVWMDEEQPSGRGFWLMLSACDYLLVDKDCASVTLHTPCPNICYQSRIEFIVPRFFIIDQGVIT